MQDNSELLKLVFKTTHKSLRNYIQKAKSAFLSQKLQLLSHISQRGGGCKECGKVIFLHTLHKCGRILKSGEES